MENALYDGLMLMVVGMTTVFIILALVVVAGKATIILTNSGTKQSVEVKVTPLASFDKSKIAAITAAVNTITAGQGRITEIKKIN